MIRPLALPVASIPTTERRDLPRVLTPARPGAVIVPASAAWLATVAAVAGLEGFVDLGRSGAWGAVAAGGLATIVLVHAYAVRVVLRTRVGPAAVRWWLVPASVLFTVVTASLLPGPALQAATLAAASLLPVITMEGAVRWRHRWLRTRPIRTSLLAPSELAAEEAIERLERLPGLQVESVVIPGCDPNRAMRMLCRPAARAVGGRMRLARRVVVSCPRRDTSVGSTLAQLVALGHTITSETSVTREAEGRVDITRANPLNLLMSRPRSRAADALRRMLDLLFSVTFLVVSSPLLIAVVVAILLDSGRPIFYRQGRVGKGGRLFQVLKFRTMVQDAEKRSGPVYATDDDPRVTRVGRILRRYRMDELPQFLNVLAGRMTLVGPRPERPHFFNMLRKDVPLFELRTCVKPGITGWAQIRVPYAADADVARAKLEYDLYYVMNRDLLFDLAILFETLGVALSGAGAR
ncbi:MAG: sugar transferase [Planctomycetota bacterium]